MMLWVLMMRLIRPFVTHQRLTRLSTKHIALLHIPFHDIDQAFRWIDALKIYGQSNQCVVRALLRYRFLCAIGEKPTLFVGIANQQQGHAWVTRQNIPYLEDSVNIARYTPIMCIDPTCDTYHYLSADSKPS